MKAKALLVHSSKELNEVFKLDPTLKDSCDIYFLTADVDYESMSESGVSHYYFFDRNIDVSQLTEIHRKALHLTDNWYIDNEGNDISMIENFSIGKCFHQFLCHVFSLAFKYQDFLKTIDQNYKEIFITNTQNSLLNIFLNQKTLPPAKIKKISATDINNEFIPSTVITFKTEGFNTFFSPKFSFKNLIRKIFISIWMKLTSLRKVKNKVFFIPAGKTRDLIQHYISQQGEREINFLFPFTTESFSLNTKNLYHEISPAFLTEDNIKEDLLNKIQKRINPDLELSSGIILGIVEEYLSGHFNGIFSYYKSTFKQLKASRPDLVMLSAESHETNIIIAQAAKNLKLKTCMIPHGITFPLLSNLFYSGPDAIYDSAFLFSESNYEPYLRKGFKKSNLFVSSFHYFSKFLPVQQLPESLSLQKALILPPDFSDFCRTNYAIDGTQKIIDTCINLGITHLAIKARIEAQLKSMFITNSKIIFKKIEIPIYSGYGSFPFYAKNCNLVIGPPSSATIESLLMGVPYFCYQEEEVFIGGWEYSNINEILYVAKTPEELLYNIEHYQIFKKEKTIDDLIYLTNLNSENDFLKLFEESVLKCIHEN